MACFLLALRLPQRRLAGNCSIADFTPAPIRSQSRRSLPCPLRTLGAWHSENDCFTTRACLTITHTVVRRATILRTNGASANARDLTPEGRPLALNTPTVFNASLNFRLNWEGNFRSLEGHAEQTLRQSRDHGVECGRSREQAARRPRSGAAIPRRIREGARRRRPSWTRSRPTSARSSRRAAGSIAGLRAKPPRSHQKSSPAISCSSRSAASLAIKGQCGRQSIPAARYFPSIRLSGAGIGSRPQPT